MTFRRGTVAFLATVALFAVVSTIFFDADDAPETAFEYSITQKIRYSENCPDQRVVLDLYAPWAKPESDAKFPCVLLIHGGGWREGNEKSEAHLAKYLAQNGYLVACATYRLLPKNSIVDAVEDCKRALKWLKTHAAQYGGDPDKIAVVGGSAGGHLSFLTAMSSGKIFEEIFADGTSDKVSACVAFAPPVNLVDAAGYMKSDAGMPDKKTLEKLSPITYAKSPFPPTLIMHAIRDTVVPISQPLNLIDAAGKNSENITFIRLNTAVHPFWSPSVETLAPNIPARAERETLEFLNKHLK